MLRIILGYQTDQRSETPTVLYAGPDGDAAQAAADESNPEKFPLLRRANLTATMPCRRREAAGEPVAENPPGLATAVDPSLDKATDAELVEIAALYGVAAPAPFDREATIKLISAAAATA